MVLRTFKHTRKFIIVELSPLHFKWYEFGIKESSENDADDYVLNFDILS